MVVSGVVILSLIVAVTLTPMAGTWLLHPRPRQQGPSWFDRLFEKITTGYVGILRLSLRWRWATVILFVSLLLLGGYLLKHLGGEFLPAMDDGRIMVKLKLPTGTSVGQTDEALQRLEAAILGDPLIDSAFSLVGGKVWGLYTYEIANEGEIDLQLVQRDQRSITTKQYISNLQKKLAQVQLPAGKAMVMQMKIKGIRRTGESDVEVKIKGPDVTTLFKLANRVSDDMQSLEQFKNVYVSMDMTKPEYQVRIDRVRAAELGVSVADIATSLRTLVGGSVATQYRDAGEYYDVRLMVSETRVHDQHDIANMQINCAQGGYVRISDVAQVIQAVGPVEIVRDNQVKQVIVRGDAHATSIGNAQNAMQQKLAQLDLPMGYELSYGGQAEMMAQMRQTVLAILAFALFFAFVVLAVQFNSLKLPAMILGASPFCLAGSVLLMWFIGLPLGATVIIGVLLVVAAIVNDGVLVLTFAGELQSSGNLSPMEAIIEAARLRFRPIAMTTLPLLVGFLPLALNLETGGDMLQPMAAAAIGGLAMEVCVALLLLPAFYVMLTHRPNPMVSS
jgi:multidrug efflux pump subunit AcrB